MQNQPVSTLDVYDFIFLAIRDNKDDVISKLREVITIPESNQINVNQLVKAFNINSRSDRKELSYCLTSWMLKDWGTEITVADLWLFNFKS
jgi:DNA helicase IV